MKKQTVLTLLVLSIALIPFVFRKPVSTIRSGDELAALSWILAVHRGPGVSSLYPVTFHISVENGETFSTVEGCASTRPPSSALPENIPTPSEYSVSGSTVQIRFSEVPVYAF